MNDYLKIRPILPSEVPELTDAMAKDRHECILPTHIVRRGAEIIGSLSIGAVPTVLVWLNTERAGVRDSLSVMQFYEGLCAHTHQGVLVPCVVGSPMYEYMEKVGYKRAASQQMTPFLKNLQKD